MDYVGLAAIAALVAAVGTIAVFALDYYKVIHLRARLRSFSTGVWRWPERKVKTEGGHQLVFSKSAVLVSPYREEMVGWRGDGYLVRCDVANDGAFESRDVHVLIRAATGTLIGPIAIFSGLAQPLPEIEGSGADERGSEEVIFRLPSLAPGEWMRLEVTYGDPENENPFPKQPSIIVRDASGVRQTQWQTSHRSLESSMRALATRQRAKN